MLERDRPTIILPYEGPCVEPGCQDMFVYLRPETNGVLVESALLRSIAQDEWYRDHVKMVYLANLPGSFMVDNRIVEEHYAFRIHFAGSGRHAFTPGMVRGFEAFFQVPFGQAQVYGAFEALRKFSMTPEELFDLWVDPFDMTFLNGQSIKRYNHAFIVNADIPALLHKNHSQTDIAVMILRTNLGWRDLRGLLDRMSESVISAQVLDPHKPASRVFHFSKSPFEQLLDGMGYLWTPEGNRVPLEQISFGRFLQDHGVDLALMPQVLRNPVFLFPDHRGGRREENLLIYTQECDYEESWLKFKSREQQVLVREPLGGEYHG